MASKTKPDEIIESTDPAEITELIEMEKDGEKLAVHPTTVEAHTLKGWRMIGTVHVDADGNAVETGKIIETPAHVIETADHFLRTLPKPEEENPGIPPVITIEPQEK